MASTLSVRPFNIIGKQSTLPVRPCNIIATHIDKGTSMVLFGMYTFARTKPVGIKAATTGLGLTRLSRGHGGLARPAPEWSQADPAMVGTPACQASQATLSWGQPMGWLCFIGPRMYIIHVSNILFPKHKLVFTTHPWYATTQHCVVTHQYCVLTDQFVQSQHKSVLSQHSIVFCHHYIWV